MNNPVMGIPSIEAFDQVVNEPSILSNSVHRGDANRGGSIQMSTFRTMVGNEDNKLSNDLNIGGLKNQDNILNNTQTNELLNAEHDKLDQML